MKWSGIAAALVAALVLSPSAKATCVDDSGSGGDCAPAGGTPTDCDTVGCTVSGGGTMSVAIAGPTTCTSASPTDCPSTCTSGDNFITNGATITISGGSSTTFRRYAICEYIVDCGTGTTALSQCTVVILQGNSTHTTAGMTRADAANPITYQHIAVAYEVKNISGCTTCNGACGLLTLPPATPTCALCTPSIAASCPVTIP